jgi:hypothetical protein
MYSTFNQRVNANVEKLLNGASLYKVCLEAETRQEILQSLKNYEIVKEWRDDRNHEEYMEEVRIAYDREYDYGPAFSLWEFENDVYSEDEYYYSYSDFWNEFCTKFDEIQNGIAEDLPSLPSDRELWILRQARKAARLFPNRYWGSGMEKAWPEFARKYNITIPEADIFWIEFHQYSNLINK